MTGLSAQAPAGEVVSSSGVIGPIVANYDKTLAFYKDLLGLTSPAPPARDHDPRCGTKVNAAL